MPISAAPDTTIVRPAIVISLPRLTQLTQLTKIALVAAISALLAATLPFSRASAQVVSPGKLSRAHRDLDGERSCTKCHAPRSRVQGKRCLGCHKALKQRIDKGRGYHASRGESRCGNCHQDHRGRSFDIVRWPNGKAAFNHLSAGYPLQKSHAKPACDDCHKPAFQQNSLVKKFPTARRKRTYLGLSRACDSCHKDDEHKGRLGDACARCHDESSFDKVPFFDHAKADFRLRGAHAKVKCEDCHEDKARKPKRIFKGIDFESCENCHEDPHRGAMTRAAASLRARQGRSKRDRSKLCESCHNEVDWKRLTYPRKDHSPRHLPLVGGHSKPPCTDCHGSKARKIPKPACNGCHKDPHARRFGDTCQRCHSTKNWRATPSLSRSIPHVELAAAARLGISRRQVAKVGFHDKTRFPLRGLHIQVSCNGCHKRKGSGYKRRFRGVKFERCSDCHKDSHAGTFSKNNCTDCHSEAGWKLTSFDVTRHKATQFPLDGSHRSVACARCHKRDRGAAEQFRYASTQCSVCHEDIHDNQFSGTSGGSARKCADCHDTRSFSPSTFDHDTTRLPLRQSHADTACGSCHVANKKNTSNGSPRATRYRGLSPVCASCHQDDHQGQFTRRGRLRQCSDCHSQKNFYVDNFNHKKTTGEPLDGAHKSVLCSACHKKIRLNTGDRVTLYRLGNRACSSCHADQHAGRAAKLRRARKLRLASANSSVSLNKCERCHTTVSWRKFAAPSSNFDHTAVGYPLRGQHRAATCDKCHGARGTKGAPKALSRECRSCHRDRHQGRLGTECANCHDPEGWRSSKLRDQHRTTRLPLTGGHALADCTSCHPRSRQGQFIAVPVACVGCHASDYTAPETHPDHRASGYGTECQQCHRPRGWSPAYFAHTTFPLRGAHRTTDCNDCHDKNPTPRTCLPCHTAQRDRARFPEHRASGFPSDCEQCHSERAWVPADYTAHEQYFPIARGKHSGFTCVECHTNTADARQFTCLAPCHTQRKMDDKHDDVRGYLYESRACLDCHPDGRE